jgi:uncharacterized membrane protein
MAEKKTRRALPETRWPPAAGLLFALALYASLPGEFLPVLRYVVVGIGLLLLVPLIVLNPRRLDRETRWSRRLSLGQAILLLAANSVALLQLISQLVNASDKDGPSLLLASVQVWITNVILYALIYWELDRGGPVARRIQPRGELPPADFRFPQDEDHEAVSEVAVRSSITSDWVPGFIDYLYFSLSNSMAFSPTDSMPLSHRAKILMGLESFTGFVILALVIARGVSLLG